MDAINPTNYIGDIIGFLGISISGFAKTIRKSIYVYKGWQKQLTTQLPVERNHTFYGHIQLWTDWL